jgi:hypothetical protein
MTFVDIFNFKKYITKPSDALTARIGHVNALYNALQQPEETVQVTSIDADDTLFGPTIEIDNTSKKGIIEITYIGETTTTTAEFIIFAINVTFSNTDLSKKLHIISTLSKDYINTEAASRFIHNVEVPFNSTNNQVVFTMTCAIANNGSQNVVVEENAVFKFMYEITEY